MLLQVVCTGHSPVCSCSTLQIAQKKVSDSFFCDVVRLGGCNGPCFRGCWGGGVMVYVSGGRGFLWGFRVAG